MWLARRCGESSRVDGTLMIIQRHHSSKRGYKNEIIPNTAARRKVEEFVYIGIKFFFILWSAKIYQFNLITIFLILAILIAQLKIIFYVHTNVGKRVFEKKQGLNFYLCLCILI